MSDRSPSRGGAAAAAALVAALPFLFLARFAAAADPEVCSACHGPNGNSSNPLVPSIAGWPAQAIATQLFQFREGNRKDLQMTPVAASLSNADMNELAAHFSKQKPGSPSHKTAPENVEAGPRLARQFNCVQCHGPALMGQQHIPRLAGQQFEYLKTQLRGFKAQTRADLDGNMTAATEPLSEKDIDVLADYISGLPAL